MNEVQISMRLPQHLVEQADEIAETLDPHRNAKLQALPITTVNRSVVLRLAIARGLAQVLEEFGPDVPAPATEPNWQILQTIETCHACGQAIPAGQAHAVITSMCRDFTGKRTDRIMHLCPQCAPLSTLQPIE